MRRLCTDSRYNCWGYPKLLRFKVKPCRINISLCTTFKVKILARFEATRHINAKIWFFWRLNKTINYNNNYITSEDALKWTKGIKKICSKICQTFFTNQ